MKHRNKKAAVLLLAVSAAAGNLMGFAQDWDPLPGESGLTAGQSGATVGESGLTVGQSTAYRYSQELKKAKIWDGSSIQKPGTYALYGQLSLDSDWTICQGATLIVPEDATLTLAGGTLTNQGTLLGQVVVNGGVLDNRSRVETAAVLEGSLQNSGRLEQLLLGGGSCQNQGKLPAAVVSGGVLQNSGTLSLAQVSREGELQQLEGGTAQQLTVSGGAVSCQQNSSIGQLIQSGGGVENDGAIQEGTLSGGRLQNSGSLCRMEIQGGTLQNRSLAEEIALTGGVLDNLGDVTQVKLGGGNLQNQRQGSISLLEAARGLAGNDGQIAKVRCSGAVVDNRLEGVLTWAELTGGSLNNIGTIDTAQQSGGQLANGGALSRLEQSGGESYNVESRLSTAVLTGGTLVNSGRVGLAQVSREGLLDNRGQTDQVELKGAGRLDNQGNAGSITDPVGNPLYLLELEAPPEQVGQVSAAAQRRDACGSYLAQGKQVTLQAQAAPGYLFSGWQVLEGELDQPLPESPTATFRMPQGNLRLAPVFVPGEGSAPLTVGQSEVL